MRAGRGGWVSSFGAGGGCGDENHLATAGAVAVPGLLDDKAPVGQGAVLEPRPEGAEGEQWGCCSGPGVSERVEGGMAGWVLSGEPGAGGESAAKAGTPAGGKSGVDKDTRVSYFGRVRLRALHRASRV